MAGPQPMPDVDAGHPGGFAQRERLPGSTVSGANSGAGDAPENRGSSSVPAAGNDGDKSARDDGSAMPKPPCLWLRHGEGDTDRETAEGPFRRRLWEMLEASKAQEESAYSVRADGEGGRRVANHSGTSGVRRRSTKAPDLTVWRLALQTQNDDGAAAQGGSGTGPAGNADDIAPRKMPESHSRRGNGRRGGAGGGGASQSCIADLRVLEERVGASTSEGASNVHCENCNCAGWGAHPVCSRQYHFIIPQSEEAWSCLVFGEEKNDRSKQSGGGARETNNRGRNRRAGGDPGSDGGADVCGDGGDDLLQRIVSCQTHLLHGVLHSNGYGHLLRLNGREGGAKAVDGKRLMTFWDRLCRVLHAREVTVQDVSRKGGIELRLAHSLMHRRTWYGEWGYDFHRGSYGRTHGEWKDACELLNKLTVGDLVAEMERFRVPASALRKVAAMHVDGRSRKTTVSDLLKQLMQSYKEELRRASEASAEVHAATTLAPAGPQIAAGSAGHDAAAKVPKQTSPPAPVPKTEPAVWHGGAVESGTEAKEGDATGTLQPEALDASLLEPFVVPKNCRWQARRVVHAVDAVVATMLGVKKWLPRQELRDRARTEIGDTGLLDFVLKSVGNTIYQDTAIIRQFNQATKIFEYYAQSLSDRSPLPFMCTVRPPSVGGKGTKGGTNSKGMKGGAGARKTGAASLARSRTTARSQAAARADGLRSAISTIYEALSALRRTCSLKNKIGASRRRRSGDAPIANAIQILLDCKLFMKDYTEPAPIDSSDQLSYIPRKGPIRCKFPLQAPAQGKNGILCIFAKVVFDDKGEPPAGAGAGGGLRRELNLTCCPPAEPLYLPSDATVGDLKDATVTAFHELYEIFSKFTPVAVEGIEQSGQDVSDSCPLGPVPPGSTLLIRGTGAVVSDDFSRQGGFPDWVVRCSCGIDDDDGERFVSCDVCDAWEHTRCAGVHDEEPVPSKWVCISCRAKSKRKRSIP